MARAEAAHAAGERLAAHLLAVDDPADERQRHVTAGLGDGLATLCPAPAESAQLVEGDRRVEALELDTDRRRDLGEGPQVAHGGLRHEDLAAHRAALDARGEVDGGADHRVLRPLLGADVAHDGLAGVDADAHQQARAAARDVGLVERVHRALHRERGGRRALGVVDVLDRRAVDREDRVADELVDRAAVRDDDIGHAAEVVVEHLHDARGVAVLGEARVPAQVGHQHGDLALAPAEREPPRRLQHGAGDLGRDVAAERVADDLALAQALDHGVERARELADLVARGDGERLRQIAARHAAGRAGERHHRPRQAPRQDDGQDQGEQHAGQAAERDRGVQLAQAVEVEVHRVIDLEDGGGAAARVEDGREGADARAAARAVDAGVAGHAVLERPRDGVGRLGPDHERLARPLVLRRGDHDARAARGAVVVGQRAHRRGQQRLVADGRQRLRDASVGGRVGAAKARGLGVRRGIDQQRAHACDVQELRADGVLDRAALALVHEHADHADGDERDEDEDGSQPHRQALPGAQRRRRRGRAHLHHALSVAPQARARVPCPATRGRRRA